MYISENSGHHHASLAIESAFHKASLDIEILNVNSFHYTNPILEKIINRTYMGIIRRRPEVWGYLYDNPRVIKKTQGLRDAIHKYNSQKMRNLLDDFRPHAVICTQAFPCGIVADCKRGDSAGLVLAGVLTDYAPHYYWLYDNVDMYFVPSEETRERLVSNGISRNKIKLTGIPIDPKFNRIINGKAVCDSLRLSQRAPIVLIMGGSQGIGPVLEIIKVLNGVKTDFQIMVVAGGNRKLYRLLKKRAPRLAKKTVVFPYAENIEELMEISSLIITKPGGITVSESLAKGLPLLIVKPIPGHEQMNTEHLLKNKVAIKVNNLHDVGVFIKELFSSPAALKNMQERARAFSKPNSALDIVNTVLKRIM